MTAQHATIQNNFLRPLSLRCGLQTVRLIQAGLLVGREIFSGAVHTEKSQTPFCPFIGEAQLGNTKIMLSISKRVHVCKVRGMTISAVSPANAEFCV